MLNVIDVSNNNGGLNVANVKVDGVIAKATENNNFTDGLMPLFMSQAKNLENLQGSTTLLGQVTGRYKQIIF